MESCHMLRYDLQFFAKDGEGGEKTEDATPKKLEDARKEGQVAKSQDLAVAILLIILFVSLRFFGGYMYDRFVRVFVTYSNSISEYAYDFNSGRVMNLLTYGGREILLICGRSWHWRLSLPWLSMWHRSNGNRLPNQ